MFKTTACIALLWFLFTGCDPVQATPDSPPKPSTPIVVYVEDHTGAAWPVRAAVAQWDAGTRTSVRYGPCQRAVKCVKVVETYDDDTDQVGRTNRGKIRLNNFYASILTPSERLTTTCHELGHALGLDHSRTQDSCMFRYVDAPTPSAPHPRDKTEVDQVNV